MHEMDKIGVETYQNSIIYKKKVKRYHDMKIVLRELNIRQKVLLYKSRMKLIVDKLR